MYWEGGGEGRGGEGRGGEGRGESGVILSTTWTSCFPVYLGQWVELPLVNTCTNVAGMKSKRVSYFKGAERSISTYSS